MRGLLALLLLTGCVTSRPATDHALDAYAAQAGLEAPDPRANLWAQDARDDRVRFAPERAASPYRLVADIDRDGVLDVAAIRVRGDRSFVVTCLSALGESCGADALPVPRRETTYRLLPGEPPSQTVLVQECGGGGLLVYPLWPHGQERHGVIDTMPVPLLIGAPHRAGYPTRRAIPGVPLLRLTRRPPGENLASA